MESSLAHTRIDLPGTTNLRDLGGLPTASGMRVKQGMLLRGEVLEVEGSGDGIQGVWHPRQADRYASLGLRTVIDLRSRRESASADSAWGRATGARAVSLPIEEGGEGTDTSYVGRLLSGEMSTFTAEDMAQFYRDVLDRRASTIGVVALLATPGSLPALVHCSAGKDRTGLVVALVLGALGVPREIVVDDYALTGVLRPHRVDAYAERFRRAGVAPDAVRTLFETPPAAMWAALSHLDERWGGPAAYLVRAAGVEPGQLKALAHGLVEAPPAGRP